MCDKILTRGRVTLCSPYIEKRLSTIFNLSVDNLADVLTEEHLINRQPIIKDYWFDNKAERIFYYEIMPEIFAGDYAQWVTPQAELFSLIPNLGINGKVDFLICHPSSSKPIVVEIDEQQCFYRPILSLN